MGVIVRWMGSTRFILAYVEGALAQRTYACQLAMRTVETDKARIMAACKTSDPFSTASDATKDVHQHNGGGLPPLRFGTVNDPLPKDDPAWTIMDTKVSTVYSGSLPYVAPMLLQFPAARQDGLIDVVVQRTSGRLTMLNVRHTSQSSPKIPIMLTVCTGLERIGKGAPHSKR